MNKITLICVICCTNLMFAYSIEHVSINPGYIYGYTPKINTNLRYLVREPVTGYELNIEKQLTDTNTWAKYYRYPINGLGIKTYSLGFPDTLGQVYALYPYILFPIVRKPYAQLYYKMGIGVAYLTKTWYDAINYFRVGDKKYPDIYTSNMITGTPINIYLTMGFKMKIPLTQNLAFTTEGNLSHVSNGNTSRPNRGINVLQSVWGVQINTSDFRSIPPKTKFKEIFDKRWKMELLATGGRRGYFTEDRQSFSVASLSVVMKKRISHQFRIGMGLEGFYDGAFAMLDYDGPRPKGVYVSNYDRYYVTEKKLSNQLRAGITIQPEWTLGRFSFGIFEGLYLYDPVKNMSPFIVAQAAQGKLNKPMIYNYNILQEDGWFYTRAVLRYAIDENLFVHFGMKNHQSMAEFTDFGVGYNFNLSDHK